MGRKKQTTKIKLHADPGKLRRVWKLKPQTRVKPGGRREALEEARRRDQRQGET